MVDRLLPFGMSPCPNDAFAFWAALHGRVRVPGVGLEAARIEDIETLNRLATSGDPTAPPVLKVSLPALAASTARHAVLPAGAALGFDCGPLVVRSGERTDVGDLAQLRGRRVAVPGRQTTARLLFQLFGPPAADLVEMRFDCIMSAVASGACDAGLIIHESRFTYADHGLVAIADLGQLWTERTALPLPLGVIAFRRDLGGDLFERTGALLRASVECALGDRAAPRPFVRRLAQELDDAVCDRHIALYVNEFTVDLGAQGRAAIDALLAAGRDRGLLPAGPPPWWDTA